MITVPDNMVETLMDVLWEHRQQFQGTGDSEADDEAVMELYRHCNLQRLQNSTAQEDE